MNMIYTGDDVSAEMKLFFHMVLNAKDNCDGYYINPYFGEEKFDSVRERLKKIFRESQTIEIEIDTLVGEVSEDYEEDLALLRENDPFIRNKILFFGAGCYSRYFLNKVHDYLDQAMSIVSGLQQGAYDTLEEDKNRIKEIYKKIGVCLGVEE